MSWFHSTTAAFDARNQASPAEIAACFQNQRNVLGRLAFLITGDQAPADQAVVQACEITLQGNSPFREWLLEWAKVRPLPVRYHTEWRRFASVKPRTRIGDAHMSSTYRRAMLKNARLVSTSFLKPTPKNCLRNWIRCAGQSWYSELQSDRRFKIAPYA